MELPERPRTKATPIIAKESLYPVKNQAASKSYYHMNDKRRHQNRSCGSKQRASEGAPAIKQVAHGRCVGGRHGRLILPCRFSVFVCCVCAFAHFCATCYRYDIFCFCRHGFQSVGAFMFLRYSLPVYSDVRIGSVSRVNSCSVSAGFQVFLKQSFHFLRVGVIDDADTGIVDIDVLMPHAIDLPRFMYHDL